MVTFSVVERDNNLGTLNNIHAGAGFNLYYVGVLDQVLQYNIADSGNATLTNPASDYPFNVENFENRFAVGPAVTPAKLEIAENALGVRSIQNWNLWACYDTHDTYNYSASNRTILLTEKGNMTPPGSNCLPVNINVLNV